jgi:hypothetical protein
MSFQSGGVKVYPSGIRVTAAQQAELESISKTKLNLVTPMVTTINWMITNWNVIERFKTSALTRV